MRVGDEPDLEGAGGERGGPLDARALQGQTVRGSLWIVFATAAGVPLALISLVVTARYLELADFGRFSLYGFVVPIGLSTLDLGLGASLGWLATLGRGNDPGAVIRTLRTLVTVNILKLPVIVVGSLLLLSAEPLAGLALAAGLAASVLTQALTTAITADRRFRPLSQSSLLTAVVGTAAVIVTAVTTRSPEWCIAAFWSGRIAAVPYLWRMAPADLRRAAVTPGRMHIDRRSWSFGLSQYTAALFSAWVFGRSELLFLERGGHVQAQGEFALASTVAQRATLLADALLGALGIALVALKGAKDERYLAALTRAMQLTTLLALSASVAITAAVSLLAPPLFGPQFGDISVAIAWLLSFALLRTGLEPVFSWIYTERLNRALLVPGAAAAVLDVGLCLLLIPQDPFVGAVAANSASTLTFIVLSAWLAHLPDEPRRQLVASVARLAPVLAWSIACVAIDLPGPLVAQAVEATLLTLAGVVVATRFAAPLLAPEDVESVLGSVPKPMQSGLRVAVALFNGGARRRTTRGA